MENVLGRKLAILAVLVLTPTLFATAGPGKGGGQNQATITMVPGVLRIQVDSLAMNTHAHFTRVDKVPATHKALLAASQGAALRQATKEMRAGW